MAFTNLEEFNRRLTAWAEQQPAEDVATAQRWLALEALTRAVMKTPVDTGRARMGWMVTIGEPTAATPPEPPAGGAPSPDTTIMEGAATIQAAPPFTVIYISNNVHYIDVLEFGLFQPPDPGPTDDKRVGRRGRVLVRGGYSVQAPQGMLGITIEELAGALPP